MLVKMIIKDQPATSDWDMVDRDWSLTYGAGPISISHLLSLLDTVDDVKWISHLVHQEEFGHNRPKQAGCRSRESSAAWWSCRSH